VDFVLRDMGIPRTLVDVMIPSGSKAGLKIDLSCWIALVTHVSDIRWKLRFDAPLDSIGRISWVGDGGWAMFSFRSFSHVNESAIC
jgi:hypothetical protein